MYFYLSKCQGSEELADAKAEAGCTPSARNITASEHPCQSRQGCTLHVCCSSSACPKKYQIPEAFQESSSSNFSHLYFLFSANASPVSLGKSSRPTFSLNSRAIDPRSRPRKLCCLRGSIANRQHEQQHARFNLWGGRVGRRGGRRVF